MEVLKDIAAIIGCILSLISLITICTKSGRAVLKGIIKKDTKELYEGTQLGLQKVELLEDKVDKILNKFELIQEVSKQQCRDTIKNIYYKYCKEKTIPLYERKTADYTYDIYTNGFNANSYVALLYSEICKWEIECPTEAELVEEEFYQRDKSK